MDKASLAALPDDVLLDIVGHFDTARDVAHLGAISRRANNVIESGGWVRFVKKHFPSSRLPPVEAGQWRGVADRLTNLDKCFEKRAFAISEYSEKCWQGLGQPREKQSVAPTTAVHASVLTAEQKECVAWGVGENLVVQSMPCHGTHSLRRRRWREQQGASQGYRPGTGDVTALSIIDREGFAQLAVGRASGDLHLQSLSHDTFGDVQQDLDLPVTKRLRTQGSTLPSTGQSAVSCVEVSSQHSLLAAGQSSTVALFNLGDENTATLAPMVTETMCPLTSSHLELVRSIKFMDQHTIVVALAASASPLRTLKVTPTGLVSIDMGKRSWWFYETLSLHGSPETSDRATTVRAIEPVGDGKRGDLILSAWDDGTYRLQDARTPSAYDAVYCNRLMPYEAGSSLLVYGFERFVTGSHSRPNLCFFDFRQPKSYHWTTAAACSSEAPYPAPPDDERRNGVLKDERRLCDPADRKMCLWHSASLSNHYRPDAALMIGDRKYDRVHSLAKASDASQSFWVGLRGGVYETRPMLAQDTAVKNLAGKAPAGWQVGRPEPKISLVETGMGMRDASDWSDSRWAVNVADWDFKFRAGRVKAKEKRARLDPSVGKFKTREGA